MKPSLLARLLVLVVLVLIPLGCPVYLDFYDPNQAAGTTGAGGTGPSGTSGTGGPGGVCAPASIAPCYNGPPGTEGHGLCQAGSKTCNADGTAYGPCVGEVTPKPEDCATPVDEDCDGLAPACKGIPLWSERAGDANDQRAWSVAADGAGNVLVTGSFAGAMDWIGCPLSKAGSFGLFVAKLDPSGACLWSKNAGDAGNQNGYGLAVDSTGSVLVTGSYKGAMDLGGCPLSNAGGTGLFVAKLDPSGACLWNKGAGDASSVHDVAVDNSGNVLVTGFYNGAMDLGGCPLSNTGGSGLFVTKLDPSGVCLWNKGAGDAGSGHAVAVDNSGNVLVTGFYDGTMDLGGCPLSNTNGSGFFIAKLDPSGTCLWSKGAGDVGDGHSVAVDNSGNVLVTGFYNGAMDLGGCPLSKPH